MSDNREDADIAKMSGAQLHEKSAAIKREVMRILDDTKLRQWAVEQAVKSVPNDIVALTNFFYNFATKKEA